MRLTVHDKRLANSAGLVVFGRFQVPVSQLIICICQHTIHLYNERRGLKKSIQLPALAIITILNPNNQKGNDQAIPERWIQSKQTNLNPAPDS
jgi:hypothetical protein